MVRDAQGFFHATRAADFTSDAVSSTALRWESSQGTVTGKVKKKLVGPTEIKGHHVSASPENPEYLVESEKTGAKAAHKPEALKKATRKKAGPRT